MSESEGSTATVTLGATHYAVAIRAGKFGLVADEPASNGGGDAGPSPFALLLSSLGACTAITLRMYCERKAWPVGEIAVQLAYHAGEAPSIDRLLTLPGLDAAQRARCAEIAEKTPVTRALKSGVAIRTEVR